MKKVLSLVLAFAMILGSFGFVFASDFPDVSDTAYYGEPVNVLSGFGVIGGFPDGTFGPEKEVTRAQMATMIVNALGMTVTGQSDTKFSDVPKSHWASGFIAYATSVGFVAGYPDGTFKPDQQVTYDQALTMIVAALGYSAESLPGTWPGSFVNKAQGLGILDICKTTGSANAPRQDVACFLYKTLDQPIGYTDKDGAFNANRGADGNVGTDTMMARLGGVDFDKDGTGTTYKPGDPFVVDGDEPTLIDLDEYFGAFITAYANKDGKIVAIKEVKSEFIDGKVNTGKTAVGDYKITTGTKQNAVFKYFENGEISTTKTAYTATTGKTMKFAVSLDGAKISEVYSAQEWTAAGTFRAGSDIQDGLKDDQKLDNQYEFNLDDDDEIDESAFIMVGKKALEELAEDDVITVYLDKVTTGKVAKLEVSTEKVEGAITKVSTAGDVYTIGGTAYDVDMSGKATGKAPKDEGTFFLNYAGEIFDFEATKNTTKNYAIALDMGMDSGRYNSNDFYLKAFLADGTVKEFAANDSKLTTYIVDSDADGVVDSWAGVTNGDVVEYEIDSDEVVVGLTVLSTAYTGATKFDDNGIYNGKAVKADTVIFSYTGTAALADLKDADNYAVLTLDDVKGHDVTTIVGGDNKGDFTAIKVTGVEESSTEFAIFVSEEGVDAKGTVWTALYEGAVKEITVDSSKDATIKAALYTTSAGAKCFTLVFDGEFAKDAKGPSTAVKVTGFAPSGKLSVSGASFKDGTTNYSLDADAVVFIYDISDKKWTVGKLASAKYNYITLIGTGSATDEVYDIVLVTKD